VINIIKASPTELWKLANEKGDNVDQQLVYDYFSGKEKGIAIEIAEVKKFEFAIDPKKIFINFRPPQSFKYLSLLDYEQIVNTSSI
jgi:predicted transcriptional regulator